MNHQLTLSKPLNNKSPKQKLCLNRFFFQSTLFWLIHQISQNIIILYIIPIPRNCVSQEQKVQVKPMLCSIFCIDWFVLCNLLLEACTLYGQKTNKTFVWPINQGFYTMNNRFYFHFYVRVINLSGPWNTLLLLYFCKII